ASTSPAASSRSSRRTRSRGASAPAAPSAADAGPASGDAALGAVAGREGQPRLLPGVHPALEVVGGVAGPVEGVGHGLAAVAGAADRDDGAVLRDLVDPGVELAHR